MLNFRGNVRRCKLRRNAIFPQQFPETLIRAKQECVCLALSVQKEMRYASTASRRLGRTGTLRMWTCTHTPCLNTYIHTYIHTYLRHVSLTQSGSSISASGRFGVSPPTLLRHAEYISRLTARRLAMASPRVSLSAPMAGR